MALWLSPAAAAAATVGNPAAAALANSGGGALPEAAAAAAAAANIPEAALNGWWSCFMGDGPGGLAEGSGVEVGGGSGSLW